MKIGDKQFNRFLNKEQIQLYVKNIAGQIINDKEIQRLYHYGSERLFSSNGNGEDLGIIHLICVLKGGYRFLNDLIHCLNVGYKERMKVSFISASSYKGGTETTGKVELIGKPNIEENDIILFVEDILDTGITMEEIVATYMTKKAQAYKIVSLFEKPNSIIESNYRGIMLKQDDFIVGYGMDYQELGRNLDEVYILDRGN